MLQTESLLLPSFHVSAVAAAPTTLLEDNSMVIMVTVLVAIQADDAGMVHLAIQTLDD